MFRRLLCLALLLSACPDNDDADPADDGGADPLDAGRVDAELVDAAPQPDAERCGNRVTDEGETCDDGNQTSGDGCRADCQGEEQCNDGLVDRGEYCIADLASAVSPPLPGQNQGFRLGDVDGDGLLDALVSHGGELHVLFNLANGSLGEPVPTGLALAPGRVARLDGDAHPDMISANGGSLGVFLGDGAGGFSPGESLPAAAAFELVDLDGDDDLDLVLVIDAGETTAGRGHVLENDGAGHFAEIDDFAPGLEPRALQVGHFDGDQRLDLAVAGDRVDANLHVFLADEAGTFGEPVVLDVTFPGGLSAADLDADGDLDLVSGGSLAPGMANLLDNDGAGGFTATTWPLPGGSIAPGLTAADLDADGAAELVGVGNSPARSFVLRNEGAGSFIDFKAYAGVPADLDGDGAVDLVGLQHVADGDVTFVTARLAAP